MKILILSLIPNTVGDNLFLTPMFRVIKKNLIKVKVHVTVSSVNAPLLKNNKNIDKLIVVDELYSLSKPYSPIMKQFLYFKMIFNLVKLMRKEQYDVCFVTQPNFFLSQLIPFLGGAKQKIGYRYEGNYFSFLLDDLVKFRNYDDHIHYVDSVLDLLKPLDMRFTNKDKIVRMNVDKLKNKVAGKYVCFQPGAKWKSKQWPIERFSELAALLGKNKIVVLGSKSEYELGEIITKSNSNTVNLCGKTKIMEAALILKNAVLSVCNNSGLAHVSSAVGTTTAVIYGSSTPYHSKPMGPGKFIEVNFGALEKFIGKDDVAIGRKKMNKITAKMAYDKIKPYLK